MSLINRYSLQKMKKPLLTFLLSFLLFYGLFAQSTDCHPDCDVTWEQIRNIRNPLWTVVDITVECEEKIKKKRDEFEADDFKNFAYLKKVACSYAAGWVENIEDECQAGGPPPCCPVQHWHKDPNALEIYKKKMRAVHDKRWNEINEIYKSCMKNYIGTLADRFNNAHSAAVACLNNKIDKKSTAYGVYVNKLNSLKNNFQSLINSSATVKSSGESSLIELFNLKEEICNYKDPIGDSKNLVADADKLMKDGKYAEAEAKYREAAQKNPNNSYAKNQAEKAKTLGDKKKLSTNSNKTGDSKDQTKNNNSSKIKEQPQTDESKLEFENKKKEALKRQAEYNKSERQTMNNIGYLAALWIPSYFLKEPLNRTYNYPGGFFSVGPYNGYTSAPVYSNKFVVVTRDPTRYSVSREEEVSTKIATVNSINFGIKTEFGYLSDAIHLTFPIKVNFGFLGQRQENLGGGIGVNLFLGTKKINHVKVALCYDYNFHYLSRDFRNVYDGGDYFSELTESSTANLGLASIKIGVRIQNHFNSRKINEKEPFVVDMFYTMNYVNELSKHRGFNDYQHPIAPGVEINISKLGIFGLFGKVIFMSAVGNCDYYDVSGSKYNNPPVSNFTIGDKGSPFFEIGIKREYCWFKKKK